MTRTLFLFLMIFLAANSNVSAQGVSDYITGNTTNFTLNIEGLGKVEGEVRVAVFNSKDTYTKEPIYKAALPVEELSVYWEVPELPFGEYAIAVYHDKNKNGKLDKNWLGIPKERYGFSNNAGGKFGLASWEDAKFVVNTQSTTHLINIR